MSLRTVHDSLPTPPKGSVVIAVARQLTSTYPDPAMFANHKARAAAIHELVDSCGLDVQDWGETDSDIPREVVEIVVPIAASTISAIATVLAAWVSNRGTRNTQKELAKGAVLGFAMQAPDGSRIQFTYRDRADFDHVVSSVRKIAQAATAGG